MARFLPLGECGIFWGVQPHNQILQSLPWTQKSHASQSDWSARFACEVVSCGSRSATGNPASDGGAISCNPFSSPLIVTALSLIGIGVLISGTVFPELSIYDLVGESPNDFESVERDALLCISSPSIRARRDSSDFRTVEAAKSTNAATEGRNLSACSCSRLMLSKYPTVCRRSCRSLSISVAVGCDMT